MFSTKKDGNLRGPHPHNAKTHMASRQVTLGELYHISPNLCLIMVHGQNLRNLSPPPAGILGPPLLRNFIWPPFLGRPQQKRDSQGGWFDLGGFLVGLLDSSPTKKNVGSIKVGGMISMVGIGGKPKSLNWQEKCHLYTTYLEPDSTDLYI